MPSMLMLQDSMFPRFTDEVSDRERLDVMQDYLYQLLEQLRYTLTNLGEENFNTVALGEIGEGITKELDGDVEVIRKELVGINGTLYGAATGDGIVARLESAEGSVSTLTATAAQLTTAMSDVKGNILSLSATASALELQIKGTQGSVTTLEATASGLSSSVTQLEAEQLSIKGNISALQESNSKIAQTNKEIRTEVSNVIKLFDVEDGNIMSVSETAKSTIEQMADKITLSVSNSGTSSTITLNAFGAEITSGDIELTGVVTFSDLEGFGTSTINGNNITTGTITGINIDFPVFDNIDSNGIHFNYEKLDVGHMYISGAMELRIGAGSSDVPLILETNNEYIYINAGNGMTTYAGHEKAVYINVGDKVWFFDEDGIYADGECVLPI